MWFLSKKRNIDYDKLISTLEKGDEEEILELLWQPKKGQVKYLPIVTTMLQKLKKDNTTTKDLLVHKKTEKGNYELIVFHIPWDNSDVPYSPLIIDKTNGKVVGVMLPFNELHNHISKKDSSAIEDLGKQWIMFTFEIRSKNG